MRAFAKAFMLLLTAFYTTGAPALTLTNRDPVERKITIIEGDKQVDQLVKPGEKIETCLKSCVIKVADGEDYEFDGQETVTLEDGLLFLDPPEEQQKTETKPR